MLKRLVAVMLAVLLVLAPVVARAIVEPLESTLPFEMDAVSVMLLDARTGTVILEKNADEKRPVASVTKLMTILLVLESLDAGKITLDDQVTVSAAAAGMGGSQALLDANSAYPLSELLKSLIVASANDAAVAFAELISGSEESFADTMNARAQELGLEDTHYVNSSGLPVEGQYTTARNVAILSREVIKHPTFFSYSKIWMDEIQHKNNRITDLVNTNRLIRFYDGADGIKTGSTNEAKFCISATAQRGDERFIAVVLGAPSGAKRFDLAGKLLTYGFDHYATKTLLSKDEVVLDGVIVKNSKTEETSLAAQDDLAILTKKGQEGDITIELSAPDVLKAPLKKGEVVGEAVAMQAGQQVARVPLVLCEDLEEKSFFNSLQQIFERWMKTGN